MLTDICPSCPFDLAVSYINAQCIEINIKNLTDTPLNLVMPLSLYRTDNGIEIDQSLWLEGFASADRTRGLVIKPKTAKIGKAVFVSALPGTGVWLMNVILPVQNQEFFISYRCDKYDEYEQLIFSLLSVEQKEYSSASPSNLTSNIKAKQEITSSVERLELIEDKFGINIESLYASIDPRAGNEFVVTVNFDISNADSAALEHDIQIQATAYNDAGQVIGIENVWISKSDFFGFDSKSILFYVDQPVKKIRLFPKKI